MANRLGNNTFKNNRQRNMNTRKRLPNNRLGARSKITDARQRITFKKRKTVADAREVLANRAKTRDARDTLLKIRETKHGETSSNNKIRAIGSNIYQKTDRNGKISLITSKNKQSTHDINVVVQQQLGLLTQNRKKMIAKRTPTTGRKSLPRNITPGLVRKTIFNDYDYHTPSFQFVRDDYYPSLNSINPCLSLPEIIDSTSPLLTKRRLQDTASEWVPYSAVRNRGRMTATGYIDLDAPEDEEMPLVSPLKQTIFMHGTSRSSDVHSRLDTIPMQTTSHGIFTTPTKTKVVVPAGHRIVVSNLQQTVTQDDIRELFEDIGQLLVARLVRPGTAEVIYKNLKDAQKAVDTYHNRQLDGQPMKCLLVNKRPINNPTGPALSVKPNSAAIIAALSKKAAAAKNHEKLVPDLQTIHKVLFQRN